MQPQSSIGATARRALGVGTWACLALASTSPAAIAQSEEGNDYDARIRTLETELRRLKADRAKDRARAREQVADAEPDSDTELTPVGREVVDTEKERSDPPTEIEFIRAGTDPKSFILPGTNTALSIGGFVHLEVALGGNGSGLPNEPTFAPVLLNSPYGDVEGRDTSLDFTARRSRLWFKSATPVGDSSLETYIETDFYGSRGEENFTNSYDLRLRRAFAKYDGWLFGQDFSTFLDVASLGELVNLGQHAGAIFVRQPQIRYTMPTAFGRVMIAAENAFEDDVATVSGDLEDIDRDDQSLPDVVLRGDFEFRQLHSSLKFLGRQLKIDNPEADENDSQLAGAVSATTRFPVFSDSLGLQYSYGALGRYLELGPYPDAFVVDGNTKAFMASAASAVYSHSWGGSWNWRSTLAYARTWAEEDLDDFSPTVADDTASAQANVFFNPLKNTTIGLEYGYFSLETGAGERYDVSRVQASGRVDF